jgi:hypothetical protein
MLCDNIVENCYRVLVLSEGEAFRFYAKPHQHALNIVITQGLNVKQIVTLYQSYQPFGIAYGLVP